MYNKKNVMVLGELHRTIVFSHWTEFQSYFFNLKNIYRKKCSNKYIYIYIYIKEKNHCCLQGKDRKGGGTCGPICYLRHNMTFCKGKTFFQIKIKKKKLK